MHKGDKEIVAVREVVLKLADALTSTNVKILRILRKEQLDISTLADRMDLSQAYISEQLRLLEDLSLVTVTYMRGKRGIRKLCTSSIEKITLILTDENGVPESNM